MVNNIRFNIFMFSVAIAFTVLVSFKRIDRTGNLVHVGYGVLLIIPNVTLGCAVWKFRNIVKSNFGGGN